MEDNRTAAKKMRFLTPRGKKLSTRAKRLHLKKERMENRPVMIEFAGTPKSGKSSSIEVVTHFFHRHDFDVFAPTEGVSKRTPKELKTDLLFYNVWGACYALQQIFEARFSSKYDLAIYDRGIFDVLAWIEWLFRADKIKERVRNAVENFLLLNPWKDMLDLVVLFNCSPATALNRENENKLIAKEGRAMNPSALLHLNEAYRLVAERHRNLFEFHPINTDERVGRDASKARQNSTERLIESILGLLESRIPG